MEYSKYFCNSRRGGNNPNSAPVAVNGTHHAFKGGGYILNRMLSGN